jgi:K+ potassium transporter
MSDSVSNRAETLSPEVQRLVPHDRPHAGFWGLTLGAIGVVYGDIGTSPLYALRESVLAAVGPGAQASETVVLGILSLIIWALVLVVTVKYVVILLRADNNGEGGTLALMALANRAVGGSSILVLLGIISGALFYGDAIITPALSVLSAIEGLKVATPAFDPYVVPVTALILIALFAAQSRGHCESCSIFWTNHARLVHRPHRRRLAGDYAKPNGAAGLQPSIWSELLDEPWHGRVCHPRCGFPGRHGCRGAVCRSRPLR